MKPWVLETYQKLMWLVFVGSTLGMCMRSSKHMKPCGCGGSMADTAMATVKKYAYEAFPSWVVSHPDVECPAQLIELNEYMNNRDIKDPWGTDYEMKCSARGLRVRSLGEDGKADTADDLVSDGAPW